MGNKRDRAECPYFRLFIYLKASRSYRGHPTKVLISFGQLCENFLTTFWWLPVKLGDRSARTGEGGATKHHVGFPKNNPASHSLHFDMPDATRNHQKVVEKM